MTAEEIVRALAAADPIAAERDDLVCALCASAVWAPEGLDHASDCPWRLAVEWVAATDAVVALEAFGLPVRLDPEQPRGTFGLQPNTPPPTAPGDWLWNGRRWVRRATRDDPRGQ